MSEKLNTAALRRIIARYRTGEVIPRDPNVTPEEAIAGLEREVAKREAIRSIIVEGDAYMAQLAKAEAQRKRRRVTAFHRLKKSPEAADPQSPAAERVQRLNRLRWQEEGRRRGRRR